MHLFCRKVPLWGLLAALPVAFGLGAVLGKTFCSPPEQVARVSSELREKTGRLTNPLLECEVFGDQGLKALKPFKYKIDSLLREKIEAGVLIDGSVYFRDLNNGMWFGINENIAYRPASMLKVPVMLAYFKLAESDPGLLGRKIVFRGSFDLSRLQGVAPETELVPGGIYTVDELIFRMIAYSDNNAAQLLVDNIDKSLLDRVLHDLDVNINPGDYEHMITVHSYAGFFRVLYNASYLSREFSEKALDILSRSSFSEGMRAGIPPGVPTATKFGEWGDSPDSAIVQLHEFGIVYFPDRPYLLGIMTRGKRGREMEALIGEISRVVYQSVSEQHGTERPMQ